MKLKNMLLITFLTLTIIPIVIVSILLYKSGFDLSKESYTRNLVESVNVQVDYISQTIENNMIGDSRFATKTITAAQVAGATAANGASELHTAITSYLNNAEDKITVCVLLDSEHNLIYSIGEKAEVGAVQAQIPAPSAFRNQDIIEFDLGDGSRNIGIVTPIWEKNSYVGCMVSVYDKSFVFKIISSYYELADSSTYICSGDGTIIDSRQFLGEKHEQIQDILNDSVFETEGTIRASDSKITLSGYYKNINNTPWFLVGIMDDALVYSFANQFLWVYAFIVLGVLIIDIMLSLYFSRKVVKPINSLIQVMAGYQNSLGGKDLQFEEENGYVETKYLRTKFLELMKTISLAQHNFEGIYQLYQSNDMGDINIDIDVAAQTIASNKEGFAALISEVDVPSGACVVEKFTHCFCDKDRQLLMDAFVEMRDEQLSVTQEADIYTPYLGEKWFHVLAVPMYTNERLSRIFIQLRDVSSFKKQEQKSSEQAKRDALTGLYNRSGFISCVEKVLQTTSESDVHALIFIDMDYFKLVNDNFGHVEGDELLRSVGRELLEAAGTNNIVSRFGGDEFVVFLTKTSLAETSKMVQEIKSRLLYPFHTDDISFEVSASVGVSTWRHDSPDTLGNLLQQADAAMYKSKREFKQAKKNI